MKRVILKVIEGNVFDMFPCCLQKNTEMRMGFRWQGGCTSNYKLAGQRTTAALFFLLL
jgi:hypothetical protein